MTDETERLRKAIASQLIEAIAADFERKGAEAVERLREKDPSAYLRAVTAVTADAPSPEATWTEVTDEQLKAALAFVRDALGARADADGGAGPSPEHEQTGPLSSVSEAEAVS